MQKTSDEIKKGLECCLGDTHAYHCDECPYADDESEVDDGCGDNGIQLLEDALALIQKLEAERDAAVEDVRLAYTSYVGACQTCKHVKDQVDCDNPLGCGHCGEEKCKCNTCDNDYSNWQWRGVQKEDSDA